MGAVRGRELPAAAEPPGKLIRRTRIKQGLTLAQLGALTGYSAAQVSRYERGVSALTDTVVLRRFADALDIPLQAFGLTAQPDVRHGHAIGPATAYPRFPSPRLAGGTREDGEGPVMRRQLLANLAVSAAAAVGAPMLPTGKTPDQGFAVGEVLVARVRDAMLGLHANVAVPSAAVLRADLDRAFTDFHTCAYGSLAVRLPRILCAGHARAASGAEHGAFLARSYLLVTRMLIKLDEQQLGWMAADRARQTAEASGDPLLTAEAARQLAVLARKAGWYEQGMSIALSAADHPGLRTCHPTHAAERGLLVQCAAYTAARAGDVSGMRELTDEAAAIASERGGTTLLHDHGGGFSPTTVQLHRISAENSAGDPSAALAAAQTVAPHKLPTTERRARYYTDVASALGRWGRRDECIRTLLIAEHHAPEETHARPAVKSLVSGLLVSGRTTAELRGLAARVGVLT